MAIQAPLMAGEVTRAIRSRARHLVVNNNVEATARLCIASAVTGFLTTFGKDEPMGCYDDFEQGDVFVFWGNNMAEMHPVLFSRIMSRKKAVPQVQVVDIGTRRTRTTEASDHYLEFKPHTDLAIANVFAREIIEQGWVNEEFVSQHCLFKKASEDIGFGLRDEGPKQDPMANEQIEFDEYRRFVAQYTPEYAEEVSGVPARQIRDLAKLYGVKGAAKLDHCGALDIFRSLVVDRSADEPSATLQVLESSPSETATCPVGEPSKDDRIRWRVGLPHGELLRRDRRQRRRDRPTDDPRPGGLHRRLGSKPSGSDIERARSASRVVASRRLPAINSPF